MKDKLNVLANERTEDNHNFELDKAWIIQKKVENKSKRNFLESDLISLYQTMKHWSISWIYLTF